MMLAFLFLLLGSVVYLNNYSFKPISMTVDFSTERQLINHCLVNNTGIKFNTPDRATFFKAELEKIVEKSADRYIAIVSYADDYDFHDEIVFNKADIANAKLIWAHDLGTEKNKALLEYYNNRQVLRVKLLAKTIELESSAGY